MKTVYLAGPINGCTDEEAKGWRERAKALLVGCEVLDPMDRDHRGAGKELAEQIVSRDLDDIDRADFVLANCWRPSHGTAMEIFYAYGWGGCDAEIAVVTTSDSPWLAAYSDALFPTVEAACLWIAGGEC